MNNSHTVEFSCAWINAIWIHWRFRRLTVLKEGEQQSLASLWKVGFRVVVKKKKDYDVYSHFKAEGCIVLYVIFINEEQHWRALRPLLVFGADLPCMRIIQVVYSLEGFSLSRHLAPSLQPSASPAPHPGTQPLLYWTGASPSGRLPAAALQWEREREPRSLKSVSDRLRVSLTPSSCLRGVLFKPTTSFWACSLLELVFI